MIGTEWERLAPPAVLVKVLSILRRFALIIIYFIYRAWSRMDTISIFNSFDLFIDFLFNILPAFLIILAGIMEYRRYRYRLADDQFHVESGWIRREKKSIPIDKIQSVQVEQTWIYRLLGIYRVKIDTIGEDDLEAEVGGVWENEAIRLREQIQKIKRKDLGYTEEISEPVRTSEPELDYPVSNREMLRYALTENFLWFLLPLILSGVILFRLYHSSDIGQLSWSLIFDLIFGRFDFDGGDSFLEDQVEISYTLLYMLLLATFYSGANLFNRIFGLFNFHLTLDNKGVQIRRGLINRFQTVIPQRKIQFSTWYTNLIRRKLGIFTLSYKYAGSKKVLGADAIVPFFDTALLEDLNSPYHSYSDSEQSILLGIHSIYVIRNFLFVKLPVALGMILVSYFIHPWLFYVALLIPLYFYIYNIYFHKNFRIEVCPDHFLIYQGVWGRRHYLVRWEKIQKMSIRQTPYQRREKYAYLNIHTAAGRLTLPYVPLSMAQQFKDYGLWKTEQSRIFLF